MQGGTVASRCSRFEPRQKAIDLINEKFKTEIEVQYYDGIPTTAKELEEFTDDEDFEDEGGEEI